MTKIDFRNAYKSDYLGSIDLEGLIEEGSDLVFTITHVTHGETSVAGKKGIFNIAYFKEDIKPLVLNSGNAKIVRKLSGSKSVNPADWPETVVKMYIDANAKLGGEVVGGVRISDQAVIKKVLDLTEHIKKLEAAKTLEDLGKIYLSFTVAEQKLLKDKASELKVKLTPKE
jgi:hypothetical protein